MKKIIVFILSIFLICNCFANDNQYDALVESTAEAYVLVSKLGSAVASKAKQLNDGYEISDNINKFIKDKKLDKKLKEFNKSIDEFIDDVQKQVKKLSKE